VCVCVCDRERGRESVYLTRQTDLAFPSHVYRSLVDSPFFSE